jgi:hypothetical protein
VVKCTGLVAALILSFTACATGPGPGRADEGPASHVLLDAFFTNAIASGGFSYQRIDDLGPRMRRFDPDRDEKLVFVAVFRPSYSATVRGLLSRPNGQQHGTIRGEVPGRSEGAWQSRSWWWSLKSLEAYEGEWQLQLWIDEQPAG